MIDRHTIKFAPAVSQKELEKALNESGETPMHTNFNKLKVRVEFEDVRKVKELMKQLTQNSGDN
jgi:hypothetical protein